MGRARSPRNATGLSRGSLRSPLQRRGRSEGAASGRDEREPPRDKPVASDKKTGHSMYRRLLTWFGAPLAALALVLGLAVWRLVEDDRLRGQLLEVVVVAGLGCGAAMALACAV